MEYLENIENKYFIYNSKEKSVKFLYPDYVKSNHIVKNILLYDFNKYIIDGIDSINDENEEYIDIIKYIINNICAIQNKCLICFKNLGDSNPRQYCMKTYCPYDN